MINLQIILDKIKDFQQKFYINELIRGVILFLSFGLLYFLGTVFIESWLWLDRLNRWILFGFFIGIECFLLVKFIGLPIFKIMGISKGISMEEGAVFIGKFFPDIDDKLLNIIQLNSDSERSEMLLASIDQRANDLRPVRFLSAVDFGSNVKYLKYLLPLAFVIVIIFLTNSVALFSNSLNRVVNPSVVYVKPAAFYFQITNPSLESFEHSDFMLQVKTVGEVVPNDMQILINGHSFLMKQVASNLFTYTFSNLKTSVHFNLEANDLSSSEYLLNCKKVPVLETFEVILNYPGYTKRANEKISNVGQLIVPRGTKINWQVSGKNVDSVFFQKEFSDAKNSFLKLNEHTFGFTKVVAASFQYSIFTANKNVTHFEPLNFEVRSVEDEFPIIAVQNYSELNIEGEKRFLIDVSDDYLVTDVLLCFSLENEANTLVRKSIFSSKRQFHNFIYTLSDEIDFIDGKKYECYFEVFDNDGILGPKSSKSALFKFYNKTAEELKSERLKKEKEVIKELETERLLQNTMRKDLEKFKNKLNTQKAFNFKDKSKFTEFIKQQKMHAAILNRKQEELLKSISQSKVEKSLEEKKADLENRIKEALEMHKKNNLLDELKELADKLKKEDLVKKLNKMANQNKQKERSLERLVEMMKRFYVEQKATKLQEDLKKLSKKQEALSEKENTEKAQESLNEEFKELEIELDALKEANEELKSPMDMPDSDAEEESIKEEMEKASENQKQKKSPKKNQKKAAGEMMEMALKMQSQMKAGEMEMVEEDMESLRAIVENLVNFSFQQEALIDGMEGLQSDNSTLGANVKKQHHLKKYFEHIDDSLYVLSLRMEKMSSKIDKELSDAHYFLGNSIEYFSDIKYREGIKSQQYVMTAVNNLAVMLSDLLDSMMNAMPMPGSGKGKGEGISLPDIIKKQSELMEKMEKGMKPGKTGEPKDGESGGEGENGKEGELYELFKEQTQIKEMFDALSKKKGGSKSGEGVSKKMDQLLDDIIEKGFTDQNLKKMTALKYELLKLKDAFKQQGEKEDRKSKENVLKFKSAKIDSILLKKYFKTKDELLLRQSLPLQHDYKIKVTKYFKTN
ncbi:MAG: hypothetical protein COB98_02440 [Flavobacteriaceae bacterium]|nr:MAG: hypothetical protein COB98_02440 [Flavobacteriaceae bacterium]